MTPEEEYEQACFLLSWMDSDLETAYISGEGKDAAQRKHQLALAWYSAAGQRLIDSRQSTFESLLGDWTQQFDVDGIVLDSILTYQRQSFCTASVPVVNATASASPQPVSSSIYLCCKPLPCPDHASQVEQETD